MFKTALGFATLHWRLIAKVAGLAGIVALLWFLVVTPRMEAAALRQAELERQIAAEKARADMAEVLSQAYKDVAAEHAANRDTAAAETKVREIRTQEIRERIVERAAKPEGDPVVSDGMDAFLKDISQ